MTRDKVLNTVNELPKEFDLEILIERLIFIEKVEKGIVQFENNETVTHQEVKDIVRSWQK